MTNIQQCSKKCRFYENCSKSDTSTKFGTNIPQRLYFKQKLLATGKFKMAAISKMAANEFTKVHIVTQNFISTFNMNNISIDVNNIGVDS